MHVLLRKMPPRRNHFFGWLKMGLSSTACGTSTLKSPPSRGSDAPHVHPRLRKCLSRCTLDCGFKTPESPALRGFEAERAPIRGTSLYLVLKSNGLHRPKIRLKKFSFSLKIVPAYISKKLPSQRCFKPLFIAFFTFSHKWPTFAFTGESGYTLGFRRKIAHKGLHAETEASPPSATVRLCAASEIPFTPPCFYIHTFPGSLRTLTISNSSISDHLSSRFSTSRTNGLRLLSRAKVGTHSALREKSHTRAHTPKQVAFRMGVVSLLSERSARSPTSPGRVSERQVLPLLGLGRGRSRGTQKACGTAMRLCASLSRRRRGPAGLRDLFAIW